MEGKMARGKFSPAYPTWGKGGREEGGRRGVQKERGVSRSAQGGGRELRRG
jgi:hypothetical protein